MRFILAVFFITVGTAGATDSVLYECSLQDRARNQGWIASPLVLVTDGEGSVVVNDPAVLAINKGPLAGTLERDNDQRLIATWVLTDIPGRSGDSVVNFRYRASLAKPSLRIEVTAQADTFDNRFFATGRCKTRTK